MLVSISKRTDEHPLDDLDKSTLSWAFHDIRNRIDEALEAAEALHDQYWAAKASAAGDAA